MNEGHEYHVKVFDSLKNFTYNSILAKKLELMDLYKCESCANSCVRSALYCRMVSSVAMNNRTVMWIYKKALLPEGQVMLESLHLEVTTYKDQRDRMVKLSKIKPPCDEVWLNKQKELVNQERSDLLERCEYLRLFANMTRKSANSKYNWDELPHLACFPRWRIEKESKFYLTQIEAPSASKIESLKQKLRSSLGRKAPTKIYPLDPRACEKHGSNLYADGHLKKHDGEKPEIAYHCPFIYSRYMTGPLCWREVWIPSKAYKTNSSWWMEICSQILKRYPEIVSNETAKELTERTQKRMKPNRSIDLKGAGLQFPREYILALHDVIMEIFPDPLIEDMGRVCRNLFSKISINFDGEYKSTTRGTGLGYYEIEKAIIIAVLLEDCEVVRMYNDDILIKDEDYDEAIKILQDYSFVINEEKSGRKSYNVVYFGGYQIVGGRSNVFGGYQRQGYYSAIFTKRFHWQRKMMISMCGSKYLRKFVNMYERTWGYEFYRGESYSNPYNLGVNTLVPPMKGWTNTYELAHMSSPAGGTVQEVLQNTFSYDYSDKKTDKEFHFLRKKKWKEAIYMDDRPYEWIRPETKMVESHSAEVPRIAKTVAMWQETNLVLETLTTTGKTACGLKGDQLYEAISQCYTANDPYRAYATGGVYIKTPYYIERAPDSEVSYYTDVLAMCEDVSSNAIFRRNMTELSELFEPQSRTKSDKEMDLESLFDPEDSMELPDSSEFDTDEDEFDHPYFNPSDSDESEVEEFL